MTPLGECGQLRKPETEHQANDWLMAEAVSFTAVIKPRMTRYAQLQWYALSDRRYPSLDPLIPCLFAYYVYLKEMMAGSDV
jgi:hypothetical protein